MIIEQHLTDMVQITDLDNGISHVSFAFEATRRTSLSFYASTDQIQAVLATAPEQPVTALADPRLVRQYLPLNPECTESFITDVPIDFFYYDNWRAYGGLPKPLADADADVPVTPDTLYSWDQRDLKVYSFTSDRPVSIATTAGGHCASAEKYDLPALAALLQAHPWVKAIGFDRGRPVDHDHVAASLTVIVALPQDVYDAATAAVTARERYFDLSDVLFSAPHRQAPVPGLGTDPLGIASALRTEPYKAPQEDWDYGETFPDLERDLPSLHDLMH